MKPVSNSDMNCFKQFEYHSILRRRYQDEEEENEDELRQFVNPAFRLEVERRNDATVYDCKCDEEDDDDDDPEVHSQISQASGIDTKENVPSASVRRTSNHYMIRKCPANVTRSATVTGPNSHVSSPQRRVKIQNGNAGDLRGFDRCCSNLGTDTYIYPDAGKTYGPDRFRHGTGYGGAAEKSLNHNLERSGDKCGAGCCSAVQRLSGANVSPAVRKIGAGKVCPVAAGPTRSCDVVTSEESVNVQMVTRTKTTTTKSQCPRESSCNCGHCETKRQSKCQCSKLHPKMERIVAKNENASKNGGVFRPFNPLIRYKRSQSGQSAVGDCACGPLKHSPGDCGCGPPEPEYGAIVPSLRAPEEPLMLPYPREGVPIEIFERYLRERQPGYGF